MNQFYLAVMLALVSSVSSAQSFPGKPIKLIVPFAPGGPTEISARMAASMSTKYLGQPMIVDFKPGGGGIVGTDIVAKASRDGYSLALISPGHAILPSTTRSLPYDAVKDFAFISPIGDSDYVLATHSKFPANTLSEFVAHAKTKPGELNFGSGALGGIGHLGAELFLHSAGIQMVHIPYKGTGPALADLISGRIDMLFLNSGAALPHSKSGKVKLLGVASATRAPLFNELPTIAELGFEDFLLIGRYGIAATAGTPMPVVQRLNAWLKGVSENKEVIETFKKINFISAWQTPEQYTNWIRKETVRWAEAVKAAKYVPN